MSFSGWPGTGIGLRQCCGSGSRIRCFFPHWIWGKFCPDPGWIIYFNTGWRLSPETIRCKKKGSFYVSSLFLCKIREPGWKNVRIRDGKMFGSGIKHPGFATLDHHANLGSDLDPSVMDPDLQVCKTVTVICHRAPNFLYRFFSFLVAVDVD
jgi:hypothetical protein